MPANSRRGFTLMEFVVVICILSASLSLIIPRLGVQMYKVQNQEAIQILLAVYAAQLDYFSQNNAWTNNINNLDLTVAAAKNFGSLNIVNGSRVACGGGGGAPGAPEILGRMAANTGGYTLHVDTNGTIRCTPCNGTTCIKMGFPQF